jgi:hypothetical protein
MPHSTINKPLFTHKGALQKEGGAGNLAKGQLAVVLDKSTANGAKVVSDFAGLKNSERIAIRVGRNKLPNNLRDKHAPYYSTDYFRIDSIVNITANAPKKTKLEVDEFIIGYDGINADSELFIPEGKSSKFDVVLYGYPVETEFGEKMHTIEMRASRAKGQTMQEVIRKLVKDLQEYTVPRSRKPLSNFVDIKVIDSTTVDLTGTPWVISTIEVVDDGTSNAAAEVQAQFNGYNVVVTNRENGVTTYGILHLVSETLDPFVQKVVTNYVKDCEDCKDGFDEFAEDGLETICRKEVETEYEWVDGNECFAQTKKFTIQLKDDDCGSRLEELQAAYPNLTITVAQGGTPAADIKGGCQTVYQTTVPTNIVCDECSCIFLQPFYAEAPAEFDGTYWKAEKTVYNPDAKMGILVRGLEYIIHPEAYARDFIPFVETSTKIRSASFGVREMDYLNFTPAYDVETEFANVIQTSKSQDVDNQSHRMFGYEDMSRVHYLGEGVHNKNLFARTALGEESLVDYNKRLITYHITYQDTRLSQFAGGRSNITHEIPIVVEEGYHKEIEILVNKLAAKVGLDTVNPTAN